VCVWRRFVGMMVAGGGQSPVKAWPPPAAVTGKRRLCPQKAPHAPLPQAPTWYTS
jgi:hypothetical protein